MIVLEQTFVRQSGPPKRRYLDNGHDVGIPRAECVAADELQIEARYAIPIAVDRCFPTALWYRVTPETVTICWLENGNEKTEEFDIQDIQLSGLPGGYFSARNERPDEQSRPQQNPGVC